LGEFWSRKPPRCVAGPLLLRDIRSSESHEFRQGAQRMKLSYILYYPICLELGGQISTVMYSCAKFRMDRTRHVERDGIGSHLRPSECRIVHEDFFDCQTHDVDDTTVVRNVCYHSHDSRDTFCAGVLLNERRRFESQRRWTCRCIARRGAGRRFEPFRRKFPNTAGSRAVGATLCQRLRSAERLETSSGHSFTGNV